MSIKLSVSNSLESLVSDLGDKIGGNKGNVFVPEYIVTQTDGMNIWIKQRLAQQLGIIANVDFKKPNDLIFKLYILLEGPFYTTISRENLVWILYRLMGEPDFIKRYPVQAAYFDVEGLERDLKRVGLAERMADLFDQYQVFRPEMIKEWNVATLDDQQLSWQTFLWIKTKQLVEQKMPDKTVVSDYIFENLKDPDKVAKLKKSLPQIYLFGLSILTRYHLDVFTALAAVIEVHFYLLNPAPDIYWLDDKNEKDVVLWRQKGIPNTESQILGNPLLTSWGKVLQNSFRLLFKNEDLINNYEVIDAAEPLPRTLLGKLQNDVFNNAVEDRNNITTEDVSDKSIVIQSCYTIAREVDALYQYLVHLVDKQCAVLSAQDIVVMVSDIDAYAPYIKAVFDNASYKFKYKIADVSIAVGDNIVTALQQILLLNEDNFTAENVMQLLDASYIRERFQLNDIELLRELVRTANIKFGTEGRAADETYLVSWVYGLKRMMHGVCMSGGGAFERDGETFYVLDVLEGAASLELIRFVHFVEVLMDSIKARRKARTISAWKTYVEFVIQDMLWPSDEEFNEEYALVLNQLNMVNQLEEIMKEPLPFEIFKKNIIETLSSQKNESLFNNGGITFCSFIPMRSIPFKVVAMLGMDHAHFPRREQSFSFNLIQQKHMLGDRNIKDNDKHLFLETVLSAKEYLYISYLGRSLKDNAHLPASVLVDELLDYIQSGMEAGFDAREALVMQQPLHEFSYKYNQEDEGLYRYSDKGTGSLSDVFDADKEVEIDFSEVAFKDIVNFCKHSVKSFYNKRLGVYYTETKMVLDETEIFELDNLQQWNLKQNLLFADATEGLRDVWVRKGQLPLKHIADLTLEEIKEQVAPFKMLIEREVLDIPVQSIPFTIQLNDTILSGKLDNVYGTKAVFICTTSGVLKPLIEAYLNLLAGIATGNIFSSVFIYGKDQPEVLYPDISTLTEAEAMNRLEALLSLYKTGLREMLPFVDVLYRTIRPDKEYSDYQIQLLVQNAIEDFTAPNTDPYIGNAFSLGYFQQEGILKRYYEVFEVVVKPLFDIFKGVKF